MRVKIRFFAFSRELAGIGELEKTMPDGAMLADLRDALFETYPKLADISMRFAVNAVYAPLDQVLHEGDEVAYIPPVGGG